MQTIKPITWLAIVLSLGLVLEARAASPDEDVQEALDALPSREAKTQYLRALISENGDSSAAANLRKSSAITLFGRLEGTNAIGVLVTNLTFLDRRYNGSPASGALVTIGEPAVRELLAVVERAPDELVANSADEDKVRWAVLTLGFIKRDSWEDFLKDQKLKLPQQKWEMLRRYAIIIS